MEPPSRNSSHTSIPDLESEGQDNKATATTTTTTQDYNGQHCGGDTDPKEEQVLDELDLMICHEDFPKLLTLVAQVKGAKAEQQSCGYAEEYYQRIRPEKAKSALSSEEVLGAIARMQEQISIKNVVVRRGSYPLTDAMMDDNFVILQREFDLCQASLDAAQHFKSGVAASGSVASNGIYISEQQPLKAVMSPGGNSTNSTDASIAVKYSKWQTDILMHWVIQHKADPFPDPQEIQSLSKKTGLSHSQVVNWTTNVRKRNRKATLGGKKPHHFIDFLFLAQDRDDKKYPKKVKKVKIENAATPKVMTTTPSRRKSRPVKRKTPVSVPKKTVASPGQYSTPGHHHPPHHMSYPRHAVGYHPHYYSPYGSSHGPPSNYSGYYLYGSPPPPRPPHPLPHSASRYPMVAPEDRTRSGRDNPVPDWRGNLNAVSSSFEEAAAGIVEPVPSTDAIDESTLHDFANFWGPSAGHLDRDSHHPMMEDQEAWMKQFFQPLEEQDDDDDEEGRDEKNSNKKKVSSSRVQDDSMMTFEPLLEPATLDPPGDLKRESSFVMEWEDLDDDYLKTAEQIVGKTVAL